MAKKQQQGDVGSARSLAVAKKGIRTSKDFAEMMASLMSDVVEGRIAPGITNAACNAGGKLLKIVELQMKHSPARCSKKEKSLNLLEPTRD